MKLPAPPLLRESPRSAPEFAANVRSGPPLAEEGIDPLRDAIIQVFARDCEILVERLNRVPETHQQAFLTQLGVVPVPPVPATVALSFKAVTAPGAEQGPVVPQFTQVAAPASDGESEPVVFETTADLQVIRADLLSAVAVDVEQRLVADVEEMISADGFTETTMFSRAAPLERAVHIAQHAILALPNLREVVLDVGLDTSATLPAGVAVEWGIETPAQFITLVPKRDSTAGLTRTGQIVFGDLPKWPDQEIHRTTSKWLTCRLLMAPSIGAGASDGWRSARIAGLSLSAGCGVQRTPIEGALWGLVALDVTRDFFPFGEWPRFGEVFCVRSATFATPRAHIEVEIKLTNPVDAETPPIPAVRRDGNPLLQWEIFTNRGWVSLDCKDGTRSLTQHGTIAFTVPEDAARTAVAGVEGGWIRARLISGAYVGSRHTKDDGPVPSMAPPAIASIAVSAEVRVGPVLPERILVESNLEFVEQDASVARPFEPFPPPDAKGILLYLGLAAPDKELAGRTISFFASPAAWSASRYPDPSGQRASAPRWEVRSPNGWRNCGIVDLTHGLNTPGIVEVHLGENVGQWTQTTLNSQQPLYWLRIVWEAPEAHRPPCLRRLVLNAVHATQAITLENELLGSSNGRPNQIFQTARSPIIDDVTLEVREVSAFVSGASRDVERGLQEVAVRPIDGAIDSTNQAWVRWSCVDDFAGSDARARHFTLDRLAGMIRFGDGKHGMIPPPGANNIRLRDYRTGGGRRGNRPARTITQLRTTIPYVANVTNFEPSSGGQDVESQDSLRRSAAAWLRHRDRAVCAEDYEDLARRASPQVAKAMCVPAPDPVGGDSTSPVETIGAVGVLVVPRTETPRPRPAFDLLARVKEFLEARCPVGVNVVALGPEYVSVCVEVEIVVGKRRSVTATALDCERRLADFLDPVTGGPDGDGWDLGERPHASDFYPVLGEMDGVDQVRALRIRYEEERPGLLESGRFLICAGTPKVQSMSLSRASPI